MILRSQYSILSNGASSASFNSHAFTHSSAPNSNRKTPGNRNRHNSRVNSDLIFSNRNRKRGVDEQKSEESTKVHPEKPFRQCFRGPAAFFRYHGTGQYTPGRWNSGSYI